MDMIDNYLGAVRWNLPAGKADDIMAELTDVIANRIEEREEALGRPLRRDEVSAVLKEFGHPLEVAGRYHGQRVLIGPEVFPFYWFILRVVLAVVALVKLLQIAAGALTGSQPFMQAILRAGPQLFDALLTNAAMVTLIFAVIEHTGLLARYLERWKPEELPHLRMRPRGQQRHWDTAFQLVFGIAFILWWAGFIHPPVMPQDARLRVEPGAVWASVYWPVLGYAVARLAAQTLRWVRPNWRLVRAALTVGAALGGIVILATVYPAGSWVHVTPIDISADQAARIADSINRSLGIGLIAIAFGLVIGCLRDLWEIYRR